MLSPVAQDSEWWLKDTARPLAGESPAPPPPPGHTLVPPRAESNGSEPVATTSAPPPPPPGHTLQTAPPSPPTAQPSSLPWTLTVTPDAGTKDAFDAWALAIEPDPAHPAECLAIDGDAVRRARDGVPAPAADHDASARRQTEGYRGRTSVGPYDLRYFFATSTRRVNDAPVEVHSMAYARTQTFEQAKEGRRPVPVYLPLIPLTHFVAALLPVRLPCDAVLSGPDAEPRLASGTADEIGRSFAHMLATNVVPDVRDMHRKSVAVDFKGGATSIDRVSSGPAMDPVFVPNLFRSGAVDVVPKQLTAIRRGGKDNGSVQRFVGRLGPAPFYETAWDTGAPGTNVDQQVYVGGLRSDLSTSLNFGVSGRMRPYWFCALLGHQAGTLALFHYPVPVTFGATPAPATDLSLASVDYVLGAVTYWAEALSGSYPLAATDGPCLSALRYFMAVAPQASAARSTPLQTFFPWTLLPVERALRSLDARAQAGQR